MEEKPPQVPKIHNQPLSVDFIETRLPEIHEAFRNLPIQYDPELKRFLAIPRQFSAMSPIDRQYNASHHNSQLNNGNLSTTEIKRPHCQSLQARELPPEVGLMVFWNSILSKAQEKLKSNRPEEPKKLLEEPNNSIRSKNNWDDIYSQLQNARENFDGIKSGFWGHFRKGYRSMAAHRGSAQ